MLLHKIVVFAKLENAFVDIVVACNLFNCFLRRLVAVHKFFFSGFGVFFRLISLYHQYFNMSIGLIYLFATFQIMISKPLEIDLRQCFNLRLGIPQSNTRHPRRGIGGSVAGASELLNHPKNKKDLLIFLKK